MKDTCRYSSSRHCTQIRSMVAFQNFPWYVNTLTQFTPEESSEPMPAKLIWFVPSGSKRRAKEVLEPLAKEYISKKAEENMEVKLLFFIASEENEASETVRRFARLPDDVPLLTIVDKVHNQVRKFLE